MVLLRVDVTQEVLLTCMTHALTTESEEIMGLLLGDIEHRDNGDTVTRVWMAYPQIRTDRRKDRVETSPEQMARSSAHAERLSRETGIRTRVVGWYHSHPHITVLPSHVDLRTQAMYQILDESFVGLIFSVFNGDAVARSSRVQLTAFQAVSPGQSGAILGSPLGSHELSGLDSPTKAAIKASMDSVAAAHQQPNALVRREVPIAISPPRNKVEQSLGDFVVMQRILMMEERSAYQKAMTEAGAPPPASPASPSPAAPVSSAAAAVVAAPAASVASAGACDGGSPRVAAGGWGSALVQLHHASSYQQGLCLLLGTTVAPALASLQALLWQQQLQARQLRATNEALRRSIEARKAAAASSAAPEAKPASNAQVLGTLLDISQ
ncbi:hypothetical protein FOA52_000355 [Chlamydomonas sp. UWO 241]|nr:hypothetical protein FOA52_000355 [Chlamydomonas sp. UWO 241]